MSRKVKVKPSIALEGTISGAINRTRFANYVTTWEGYQTLMSYLKHDVTCTKQAGHHLEPDNMRCDCGLTKLLTQGVDP